MTSDDADRTASHEAADCGRRNELDNAADSEQTDGKYNETTDEGKRNCDFGAGVNVRVGFLDVFDNVRDLERHDCDRANGDILRGGKELM